MTGRNKNFGELVIPHLSLTACLVPDDDFDYDEDEDKDKDEDNDEDDDDDEDDDIPWELGRHVKKLWEENMVDSDFLRKLAMSTSERMTNALISTLIIICKKICNIICNSS